MQKKKKKFGNFYSPQKKGHFRAIFRNGQRSVTAAWATHSPWSILLQVSISHLKLRSLRFSFKCTFSSRSIWTKTSQCLHLQLHLTVSVFFPRTKFLCFNRRHGLMKIQPQSSHLLLSTFLDIFQAV